MKRFRITLITTFVLASAGAVMAQSVWTDFDHSFNLARLKVYDFSPETRSPGDPLAGSPLNDRRIHEAIDSQLKANGFVNSAAGQPDFLISYFVTTHQNFDIRDNRTGVFWRNGSVNVNAVTAGSIVVRFIDAATHQEVWRGFVSGDINAKHLNDDINKGIAKLVKQFVKDQR